MPDKDWLQLAKESYLSSTSYLDNNFRKKIEDNLRHFQSKHHAGSKYNKPAYKLRTRIFRPKTRAFVRSNEAAAVAAFFANKDAASIEPQNPDDPLQEASAEITKELLNYRLENSIPWFVTCIGALQDAQVVGVVASYQSWEYEERQNKRKFELLDEFNNPIIDGETGKPVIEEQVDVEVIKDRPVCKLLPIENIRIHPGSDWTDPINTSPYLIIMWPVFVKDVKAKMKTPDPKTGEPKWKKLDDGEIKACTKHIYDSTRLVRESQREDSTDNQAAGKSSGEFDVVWVHENFIDIDGHDYVYLTMGIQHMLTDPVPIQKRYFHGSRPVTMGCGVIETHKIMPDSLVELGSPIQKELNENACQRSDNVKLVMNKRWKVKRGSQVNPKTLTRNVAGDVIFMNKLDDVEGEEFHDVTGSSYMEQDRLNVDFDELVGMFSPSTIQTNRQMGETVGGMKMLRGGVNNLVEYLLMTFSETWLEDTIKQLIKLEQYYETDQTILAIAAQKAQLFQKYGIDQVTDELLNQNLTIKVNVGMGATDPMLKLERFLLGVQKYTEIETQQMEVAVKTGMPPSLNLEEVQKEIFGRLGHRDGMRFFNKPQQGQDPQMDQLFMQMQQMQQMIEQLQAALEDKQADRNVKLLDTQIKQEAENQRKAAELKTRLVEKSMDLRNPVVGERVRATA
jgi:hypothetical protein